MAFVAGKRISISGAGVGGTAFALALELACKTRGISPLPMISIFERDANPSDRENLGYSFSLVEEAGTGGLQVVRQLQKGILADLEQLQEPGSDTHICWRTFQPLIEVSPKQDPSAKAKGFDLLRIMRTRLRQTLLFKVQPEWVHYGKVCVSAEPAAQAEQPVQLTFADGSTEECDLLVVADGANSKLRTAMLPHEVNRYAGVCMLFGRTRPLKQLPPQLQKGHYLVLGRRSTSLFVCSVDKNTATWALTSKVPESRVAELNKLFKDPAAAQDFLDREVPKIAEGFYGELLGDLLRETEASSLTAIPAVDKLPHAVHGNGVAYVGDAWHPMSPFAGAGANMALQDAWELAQQLTEANNDGVQAAISQYAAGPSKRSVDAIKASHKNIALAHSDGWKKLLFVTVLRTVGAVMRLSGSISNWISRLRPSSTKKRD